VGYYARQPKEVLRLLKEIFQEPCHRKVFPSIRNGNLGLRGTVRVTSGSRRARISARIYGSCEVPMGLQHYSRPLGLSRTYLYILYLKRLTGGIRV
jgi:hypothetical protein